MQNDLMFYKKFFYNEIYINNRYTKTKISNLYYQMQNQKIDIDDVYEKLNYYLADKLISRIVTKEYLNNKGELIKFNTDQQFYIVDYICDKILSVEPFFAKRD